MRNTADRIIDNRPLSQLTRMELVVVLQNTRAELIDAKSRIRDLEGEVQAILQAGDTLTESRSIPRNRQAK